MENAYQWVPFYEALADKLLSFKDKRRELFDLMKGVASQQPLMKYFHFEREDWWGPRNHQIDTFSIIGVMNRGMTDANRTALAKILAKEFDIELTAPTQFAGIPVLDNKKSFFAGADEIWSLFVLAMTEASTGTFSAKFKTAFENAIAISGNGLADITMGLYCVKPNVFMPLDINSRMFVSTHYGVTVPSGSCSENEYVSFLETLKKKGSAQTPGLTFTKISYTAWFPKDSAHENVVSSTSSNGATDTLGTDYMQADSIKIDKNIILYGAPCTGKTYSTVQYAVSIIEEKSISAIKSEDYDEVFRRYLVYKDDGIVAFTTFHQSFGYEEFIEGIRPKVTSEDSRKRIARWYFQGIL